MTTSTTALTALSGLGSSRGVFCCFHMGMGISRRGMAIALENAAGHAVLPASPLESLQIQKYTIT